MNVVKLKRPVRPLRKTYQPNAPYVVERHDEEDGSIQYEIWDHRPESYRRLTTVTEEIVEFDVDVEDRGRAMRDAELICRALNFMHGYIPS